jgi:hypothetical protein
MKLTHKSGCFEKKRIFDRLKSLLMGSVTPLVAGWHTDRTDQTRIKIDFRWPEGHFFLIFYGFERRPAVGGVGQTHQNSLEMMVFMLNIMAFSQAFRT